MPPDILAILSLSIADSFPSRTTSSVCFFRSLTLFLMSSSSPRQSISVVWVLVTIAFLHLPKSSSPMFSKLLLLARDITLVPVRMARSFSVSDLFSPKPGDRTAHTFSDPLTLFRTKPWRASPSTSSAIIKSGFPEFRTVSRTGIISLMESNCLLQIRT